MKRTGATITKMIPAAIRSAIAIALQPAVAAPALVPGVARCLESLFSSIS
jgi:hypothetical protein